MAAVVKTLRPTVVVILGATGSGKSKLALEIANRFNGEIISADSMQVYKGLDIITNKVTPEEQKLCKHHMLNFLSPLRSSYSVVEFRNKALPIIDDLLAKEILPIIVGGTNYYIEALLWKLLLDSKEDVSVPGISGQEEPPGVKTETPEDGTTGLPEKLRKKFVGIPSEELHQKLQDVDPEMAKKLHPKNMRKIIRALEVFEQHGVTMSEKLEEQHQEVGSSCVSGPLRYPNPCILWTRCQQKVLDERTDARVDDMLKRGLIKELTDFHQNYNLQRISDNSPADYTLGIFQSIGFKEFHKYLLLSHEDREKPLGKVLFDESVDDLKRITRKYARKQVKWITNRFLKRSGANVPPVYGIDTTDPSQWDSLVHKPAMSIIQAFQEGNQPSVEPVPCEVNRNLPVHNICDLCGGLVFVTTIDWEAHLKGRRHKKAHSRQRSAKHKGSKYQDDADEPVEKQKRHLGEFSDEMIQHVESNNCT